MTDTERLDWMEKNTWYSRTERGSMDGKQYFRISYLKNLESYDWAITVKSCLREAIDAAMEGAP